MSKIGHNGGSAFPHTATPNSNPHPGMSLRDYYAGQALLNPNICTGKETNWRLGEWFGDRVGITREEIVPKQAFSYADAMIAERGE